MQNLIGLDSPISKLKATHNNGGDAKRDSGESNGLISDFYLSVGSEVMLTSNFGVCVVLHTWVKVKVVNFYTITPTYIE